MLIDPRHGRLLGGGRKWYRAGGAPAPVAAYQPKGAASLAASYVNLANPGTYNAAPGTAPTFAAATGWTFNGSTQYLTTGVVPSQNTTLLVRFADTTGGAAVSARTASSYRYEIWPTSGTNRQYANGQNYAVSGAQSSAVMGVAGLDPYLNGADDGTLIALAGTPPAMYIGACNNNGTAAFFFTGKIQAVVHYNSVLTAAQVAAVSAAMAAL